MTKKLLDSSGIRVEITESEGSLKNWMVETTANGTVNVCILYGVLTLINLCRGEYPNRWVYSRKLD